MRSRSGAAPPEAGEMAAPDQLLPFRTVILAVRAAAGLAPTGLTAGGFADGDMLIMAVCVATVGYSVLRILYPLTSRADEPRTHLPLAFETAAMGVAVLMTGFWSSPFVFMLSTAIV